MPAGKRTLSQWVKFANSLRLRLAIRVSMSAPDLARAEVAKAMDATAGGVLEVRMKQLLFLPKAVIRIRWEQSMKAGEKYSWVLRWSLFW